MVRYASGGIALVASVALSTAANAADIKVFSAVVMKPVLEDLAKSFGASTGNKVSVEYAPAGAIRDRIMKGDAFDIAILPLPAMEQLVSQSKIVKESVAVVARSTVALCKRSGAPRLTIDTVDALKGALLNATSVAYSDPVKGGASGIHFARVLDKLGIAAEMRPKSRLTGSDAPEVVARGEAEICASQTMEILATPGVDLVGALPEELQSKTDFSFSSGIGQSAAAADAAKALSSFLLQPDAARTFKAKGMEPGRG